VFQVERVGEQVTLHVEEGKVRVTWQSQTRELAAGSRDSFPLGPAASASQKDASLAPANEPKPTTAEAWRAAAREGRYGQAFELLEKDNFASVREDPSDLLLAADVARLSGHPGQAVAPLRKVVQRHHADPRAPAAAFTLGSVLLRDLGRPAEAAQAFNQAERLAPGGNLAEDSLARATEAWLRAGERARAEAAFSRYSSAHPGGRHLARLQQLLQSRR
jgi:transmembrane sensor